MGLFTTTTAIELYWVGSSFDGLTALASDVITDAENKVREKLSTKYDVSHADFQTTTGTVPPVIETVTKWMAVGLMMNITSRGGKESEKRGDGWIKRAMDNLDEILSGKAQLLDASGEPIAISTNASKMLCNTSDYAPTFNEDSPLNWQVDQDKIDDIQDERE